MPFALFTGEKYPRWCEFAENAETGQTTQFIKKVTFLNSII